MDPKQFGSFLTEERKAKNLTQKELADKLGVTDKAVSKWERGVCLPDVSKFDDIADALGLTDLEVLRAKRLPPEPAAAPAPPPFITGRQIGQLLLGWAAAMAVLFLWELLEIGEVVHIYALGSVLRPLFAFAAAVWLALRDAKGVARIDWRGVCIVSLCLLVLLLLFFMAEESGWIWWYYADLPRYLFGLNGEYRDATWSYFYDGGVRWEPRWMAYWFLALCYFDLWPLYALLLALVSYPVTKLLRIRRNQRRSQSGTART